MTLSSCYCNRNKKQNKTRLWLWDIFSKNVGVGYWTERGVCRCYWTLCRKAALSWGCWLIWVGACKSLCLLANLQNNTSSGWHRDVVFHVAAADARMFSPKALTSLGSFRVLTKAENPIVLHKCITWHTVTFTAVVKESTGCSGIWLWGKSLRHSCRTVWIQLLILWHLFNISTDF